MGAKHRVLGNSFDRPPHSDCEVQLFHESFISLGLHYQSDKSRYYLIIIAMSNADAAFNKKLYRI